MRRTLRWLTAIVLLASGLYVGASWAYAYRLTGARHALVGSPPADFPHPIEAIQVTTRDNETLAGWFVPAPGSSKAIVLLHGYSGNRKQMLPRARLLRERGYAVLLYDARGCGESTGDRITFGYRERADLIAAIGLLKARGYPDIACLGVSQGGATILFAAEELDGVRCVVCESVYDEMTHAVDRRTRRYLGLPGWLGASLMVPIAERRVGLSIDDVRPVDHVARLGCPIFIISGDQDDRTWPQDTQRLFDAAREPKELWMIEGARHEDLFRRPGYTDRVLSFLERHSGSSK